MSAQTWQEAMRGVAAGELRPVYVIVGPESHLASELVSALRKQVLGSTGGDFNCDVFYAAEATPEKLRSAVRMVPMMAKRRYVELRDAQRWEARGDGKAANAVWMELLGSPISTSVLVASAPKLDKRKKLYSLAKKHGFLVTCDVLSAGDLRRWIEDRAKSLGVSIHGRVAELLGELAGPEVAPVADALERLSLYVGPGGEIDETAVSELVVKVREASVFELVDAVGAGNRGRALALLGEVYDPRDRGLPLLGLLAWSVRQLARFEGALAEGLAGRDAANAAGVPPFRASKIQSQIKRLRPGESQRWLMLMGEADRALKGSKRDPRAVLETLLLDMLRARRPAGGRSRRA